MYIKTYNFRRIRFIIVMFVAIYVSAAKTTKGIISA